jgi:succinate dehydrogenase / fumarate reductase membrane anchor subunit
MSGQPLPTRRFAGRPAGALPGYVPSADIPTDDRRASSRAGSLWLVKAVTGVLLVVFLGSHLVLQHFLVEGGLRDYAAVVAYLRNPVALLAELGLLVTVIVHAALGVRAVLVDMLPSERALRRASWVIGVVSVVSLVYGIGLTLVVLGG